MKGGRLISEERWRTGMRKMSKGVTKIQKRSHQIKKGTADVPCWWCRVGSSLWPSWWGILTINLPFPFLYLSTSVIINSHHKYLKCEWSPAKFTPDYFYYCWTWDRLLYILQDLEVIKTRGGSNDYMYSFYCNYVIFSVLFWVFFKSILFISIVQYML